MGYLRPERAVTEGGRGAVLLLWGLTAILGLQAGFCPEKDESRSAAVLSGSGVVSDLGWPFFGENTGQKGTPR